MLTLRPAADCRWDCAALGEVMLRFDPGDGRVRNARTFQVWEGGGEYNVARALRKTWGCGPPWSAPCRATTWGCWPRT